MSIFFDKIDAILIGLALISTVYGLFMGPFTVLIPLSGTALTWPLLKLLKPALFPFLASLGLPAEANEVLYGVIGYLLVMLLLISIGRWLDLKLKKISRSAKLILGGLCGLILALGFELSVLVLLFPLIKSNFSPAYQKSICLSQVESLLESHPHLQKLFGNQDKLKEINKNLKTFKQLENEKGKLIKQINEQIEMQNQTDQLQPDNNKDKTDKLIPWGNLEEKLQQFDLDPEKKLKNFDLSTEEKLKRYTPEQILNSKQ